MADWAKAFISLKTKMMPEMLVNIEELTIQTVTSTRLSSSAKSIWENTVILTINITTLVKITMILLVRCIHHGVI